MKDAGQIGIDDFGPLLWRHVGDIRKTPDPGVVHHEVEAAEPSDRRGDCSIHLFDAAHVGLQRLDAAGSGPFQLHACRGKMRRIASSDRHLRASSGDGARDCEPDAARSAGNERDFAAEIGQQSCPLLQ